MVVCRVHAFIVGVAFSNLAERRTQAGVVELAVAGGLPDVPRHSGHGGILVCWYKAVSPYGSTAAVARQLGMHAARKPTNAGCGSSDEQTQLPRSPGVEEANGAGWRGVMVGWSGAYSGSRLGSNAVSTLCEDVVDR